MRKPRKSKLQNPSVTVLAILIHFQNLLKPVNIKGTKNWKRILYLAKGRVDDETLQMIKDGYVFQNDVRRIEFIVKGPRDYPVMPERRRRPRITFNPVPVNKEDYAKWISN